MCIVNGCVLTFCIEQCHQQRVWLLPVQWLILSRLVRLLSEVSSVSVELDYMMFCAAVFLCTPTLAELAENAQLLRDGWPEVQQGELRILCRREHCVCEERAGWQDWVISIKYMHAHMHTHPPKQAPSHFLDTSPWFVRGLQSFWWHSLHCTTMAPRTIPSRPKGWNWQVVTRNIIIELYWFYSFPSLNC